MVQSVDLGVILCRNQLSIAQTCSVFRRVHHKVYRKNMYLVSNTEFAHRTVDFHISPIKTHVFRTHDIAASAHVFLIELVLFVSDFFESMWFLAETSLRRMEENWSSKFFGLRLKFLCWNWRKTAKILYNRLFGKKIQNFDDGRFGSPVKRCPFSNRIASSFPRSPSISHITPN